MIAWTYTNATKSSASGVLPDGTMVSSDVVNGVVAYDGSTIIVDPVATPAPIPARVTMAQARIALLRADKLAAVQSAVDATGTSSETSIWWNYASIVERANPLVAQLGAQVGLSAADIDSLFQTAEKIV